MTIQMRDKAQELVAQLPQQLLPEAIELLQYLTLKVNQVNQSLSENLEEASLLEIIQHKLTENQLQKFDDLQQKNEEGKLTESERCELLDFIAKIEEQDLKKTEALIKLAQIRQVSLKELLEQFSFHKINR